MSSILISEEKIGISDDVLQAVRDHPIPAGFTISVRTPEGEVVLLPEKVQELLIDAVTSVALHGRVSIGRIPEQLTSTEAADILSVSRPTLMKWAREGEINFSKAGTHTRFMREDVLQLKEERAQQGQAAFNELREATRRNLELFDD